MPLRITDPDVVVQFDVVINSAITFSQANAAFTLADDIEEKKALAAAMLAAKAKLDVVVKKIGSLNFTLGYERPIEWLARQKMYAAVELLLTEYQGDYDFAVRGFARANDIHAVERMLRSGADLDYAVMGYMMAGDIHGRAASLLGRCASLQWAIKGAAFANHQSANSLTRDCDGAPLEHTFPDALYGYACGGHLASLENLFLLLPLQSPLRRTCLKTIIAAFASMNNVEQIVTWITRFPMNDNSQYLADGYARGGRITVLQTHYSRYPSPDYLPMIMQTLATSGFLVQARQVMDQLVMLGIPLAKYAHQALLGFVRAASIVDILQFIRKDASYQSMAIITIIDHYKFYLLQALYNHSPNQNMLEQIAAEQEALSGFGKPTFRTLRALPEIETPALKNIIVANHDDSINDRNDFVNLLQQAMVKNISWYETTRKIVVLIDKYQFTGTQARAFQALEVEPFSFFLQVLPNLMRMNTTGANPALLIATYLMPAWEMQYVANYRPLSLVKSMQTAEIIDFGNKIFAAFYLATNFHPTKRLAVDLALVWGDQTNSNANYCVSSPTCISGKKNAPATTVSYQQNSIKFFELATTMTLFTKNPATVTLVAEEKLFHPKKRRC